MKWAEVEALFKRVEDLEHAVAILHGGKEISYSKEGTNVEASTTQTTPELSLDSLAKDVSDVRAVVEDVRKGLNDLLQLHKSYGFTSAFIREVTTLADDFFSKGTEVQAPALDTEAEPGKVAGEPVAGTDPTKEGA